MLVCLLSVTVCQEPALPTGPQPAWLNFIESSAGLDTPPLEFGPSELQLGDVNGDGHPDLVCIGDHGSPTTNPSEHGIMTFLGDGTGRFAVSQSGHFGYGGVALGDLDGDGLMDVAYAMHHNEGSGDFGDQLIEAVRGDGSGRAWQPWDDGLATDGEDYGMFGTDLADIDNDGWLDIGVNSFGCCAGVHVYRNAGNGTWQPSFGFLGGNSRQAFTFGDVNGDGLADFAVAHQDGTVYFGDGTGGFNLADGNLPGGGSSGRQGLSLGDVDADGKLDLAWVNNSGGVEVWSYRGASNWAKATGNLPHAGGIEATQLVDMDRDGSADLIAFGSSRTRIFRQSHDSSWHVITDFRVPSPGYFAALDAGVDVDHNGFPDIAIMAEEGKAPNNQNHLRLFKQASPALRLSIRGSAPSRLQTLRRGAACFIDWTSVVPRGSPAVVATVAIELSTQGPAGPFVPIAAEIPNSGRHQWIVSGVPTDQARLRFTITTGSITAVSVSEVFHIR